MTRRKAAFKPLAIHPLAELFPPMGDDDFATLCQSLQARGFDPMDPIVVLDRQVIDGRNRQAACVQLGIRPVCRDYDPAQEGDPLAYVLRRNLARRHLNESQRALVAAQLVTLKRGDNQHREENSISVDQAAAWLRVSARSVAYAAKVKSEGTPAIRRAVENGHLAVSAAAQAVDLAPQLQKQIAKKAESGGGNVVRTVIKKAARELREKDLAERQRALPSKQFGLIYADPEWKFTAWDPESGMDRAADNHYPTSETEAICARPVQQLAAPDCVLALWATAPMLPDALRVLASWGFTYKTHAIWKKLRNGNGRGSGYWFTGEHELLLIGTRGNVPAPATAICGSVIDAPAGKHSAKPEIFAQLLEQVFPNLPKIELNRRGKPRAGWEAWGNEAELDEAA
jgi:N6-adenosine-specific RNA methylase IME4